MGATSEEREAREILKSYASILRQATHGDIYVIENRASGVRRTVLVTKGHTRNDPRTWKNVLAELRRAVRDVYGVQTQTDAPHTPPQKERPTT